MATTVRKPKGVSAKWRKLLMLVPGYDPFATAGDCWFDEDAAQRALDFFPECLRHVEGSLSGQPFELEDWQKAYVANLFGWMRKDEFGRTVRRYRESLLYVPRKNGKTPLCAGIALYVFFCDGESGAQCYVAAGEREQAGMLFRQMKGMVEQEPELSERCRIYGGNAAAGQSKSIVREEDGSFLRVISADAETKHGGNTHLAIVDELHVQPNRDLVDVLQTSLASANRRQPLLIYLTTADFDRPSICNIKLDEALRVRDNKGDPLQPGYDPAFLPCIYRAEREDDWTDEAVWEKCNPNLGVSVSINHLRRECRKAQEDITYQNTFKQLHLNMTTSNSVAFIDMQQWDSGALTIPELEGRECYGGLDLSTTTDISAFVLLFLPDRENGPYFVLPFFWIPGENAHRRERDDKVWYQTWCDAGLITPTYGHFTRVIDYDVIRRDINALGERYDILDIGVDRWNATQLTNQLGQDGFEMVEFGQGYQSMTAPTKELEKLVISGRLVHGGNPVLRWMAGNLMVERDAAENLKPTKKASADRIDGMVALIMAIGRAMANGSDLDMTYETYGNLSL